MIELRHLRAIAALAETGSVTRAATRLNLTQSALSHQLAALETLLGLAVVQRGARPLKLTAAGERLLALAREVLPRVEETVRELEDQARGGVPALLRIAVECHTCYDWLMPAMDAWRERHPEVEQDLVPGFHTAPLELLHADRADVVIVSEARPAKGVAYFPLFRYEMVSLVARGHRLASRPYLRARDFGGETLITYPVPDRMLDVVRRVLKPAGVDPPRRTAELTVAILQLVASRRGIAALPRWAVQSYIDRGYVAALPIGPKGLWGKLYCAVRAAEKERFAGFAELLSETAAASLPRVERL